MLFLGGIGPPWPLCRRPMLAHSPRSVISEMSVEDDSGCSSFPQTDRVRNSSQTKEENGDLATTDFFAAVKCRWTQCGKWFSNLNELATHVSHTHSVPGGQGLFYCGWEGCLRTHRGFNARYKMLVHVRTHTNEKPHTCYECQKSFSRAENLKIHARSHTGEKPYICPVSGCYKAYSNSSDRFKHTRTHSIDRPYTCKVPGCTKRYTDPSSLRKHTKTNSHFFTPQLFLGTNSQTRGEKASEINNAQQDEQRLKIECVTTHFPTSWLQSIYPNNTLSWNRLDEQEAPLDLTVQTSSQNYNVIQNIILE